MTCEKVKTNEQIQTNWFATVRIAVQIHEGLARLTLPLLMPWICTNNVNAAVSADHFTVLADAFYARPDLHFNSLIFNG